ncbi:MAG: SDR family oxidoreductase [Pyrinomonadaceae bacterium]|nr:SDR family oxidoreductase [Pyrinomonadaceae bacterium]
MKLLVIGGGGMLGHKLVQVLGENFDVRTTIRKTFDEYEKYDIFNPNKVIENIDVENFGSVEKAIKKTKPDVIINAVGVIKQLPTANNVIKTLTVNAIFPHRLLVISEEIGARLINISTDCVFSGKDGNYTETDISDALDVYGKSKFLGETISGNSLTIRTSIIGRELNTSHSLVEWFLSNQGKRIRGYTKAIFSGFPTVVLAAIIRDIIANQPDLRGLYNVSSAPIDKYNLLKLLKQAYQVNIEIEPFDDFVIDRSLDSTGFREATGFKPLGWQEMIKEMAADNAPYQNTR